jgi:hypothetical protein
MNKTARSPAYPGMTLEQAIQKTHKFYAKNKRYPVDRTKERPDAFTSIDYTGANGASKRALAALLAFGLLERIGGGDESKVRVSDLGYKIVALPEDDPERADLIREASTKPKIYADLLDEFSDGLPASDTPIQSFLIKRGFNPEPLPGLIADLRATLAFAKAAGGGTLPEKDKGQGDQGDKGSGSKVGATGTPESKQSSLPPDRTMRSLAIPLGPNTEITLTYPVDLSATDFEFFKEILDKFKTRIVVTGQEQPTEATPSVRPGPALWRQGDADSPVEVVGYLGKRSGRHYVSLEGSDTGAPLDEIHYEE